MAQYRKEPPRPMTLAPEHAELNEHLNAYVDRAVDEPVRRRLTAHLSTCAACRADLAQLRATRDAVRDLPTLRAPRPFTLPEPVQAPGTPTRAQSWLQGRSGRQDREVLPSRGRDGWILTWTWRLGALGTTICLLISLSTVAVPSPYTVFTGAADSASRASSAPTELAAGAVPAPPESLARAAAPSSAASPAQQAQQGVPAPALAERDSSQRLAPAAPAGRAGVPQSPARASEGSPGTQSEVARSPASRAPSPGAGQSSAAQWLALAVVLALPSAALFALDRRTAARVGVR